MIGFSGGAMRRERVGKRGQSRVKRAPRRTQWLFGLQHDGKFGEIEAADVNQRARTGIGRNLHRMGKGVADLAQRDGAKRRRQIETRRKWRTHATPESSGILASRLVLSTSYNYSL